MSTRRAPAPIRTRPPQFYDYDDRAAAVDATRKAIDPYGIDGEQASPTRPGPSEVLHRLNEQGFVVVKRTAIATDT